MNNSKNRYRYSALCILVVTTMVAIAGYFAIPNACHKDEEGL